MRANKIRFDAIHARWEILKMSAAYIHAEQKIVFEASKGNDITGASTPPMSSEEFFHAEVDGFGNIISHISEEEYLMAKGREVQEKMNKAVEEEDYKKAEMFKNVLKGLKIKYNKLKGRK